MTCNQCVVGDRHSKTLVHQDKHLSLHATCVLNQRAKAKAKQCTRAQTCAMNRSMQAGKRRKLLLILSTTCKMCNSQPFIPEVMVSSDSESEAVKGGHSCEMRLRYPQSQLPPQPPGVNTASGMPQQMPSEALLQEQACNLSG